MDDILWLRKYVKFMSDPLYTHEFNIIHFKVQALKRMKRLLEVVENRQRNPYYSEHTWYFDLIEQAKEVLGQTARIYLEIVHRPRNETRIFLERVLREVGLENLEPSLGEYTRNEGKSSFNLNPNSLRELVDMVSPQEVPEDAEVVLLIRGRTDIKCKLSDLQCSFQW